MHKKNNQQYSHFFHFYQELLLFYFFIVIIITTIIIIMNEIQEHTTPDYFTILAYTYFFDIIFWTLDTTTINAHRKPQETIKNYSVQLLESVALVYCYGNARTYVKLQSEM